MADISIADVLALTKTSEGNGFSFGGVGGLILILLFFFIFGGWGRWGQNGNNEPAQFGLSQVERDVLTTSCNTQKEILQSRYDSALANQVMQAQLAQCCCDIKSAVHSEGEATRALIQGNTIQELRDRLNTANSALTAQTISDSVINAVRPFPSPAWLTTSPYASVTNGCYQANACCASVI